MAKKGKLLFKGEKRPKKKSKKSKTDRGTREETDATDSGHATATSTSTSTTPDALPVPTIARKPPSSSSSTPTIQTGRGKITTSGTVVTGHDTKFVKELSIGDAILVTITNTETNTTAEEMRVVTMRLSDISVNLSSAFSQSLREPQGFRYVRKPRNLAQEQQKKDKKKADEEGAVERNAFDIYGKTTSDNIDGSAGVGEVSVFTYREKTETGSYRVKQQEVSAREKATRGGLLALRSKKSSDKYC